MIRVLFLVLVVMSMAALAQTEKPQARKIDEFETATNGEVKRRTQQFYVELSSDPNARGYVFNFGTDREIARRERQIRDAITFLNLDSPRITIVNAGFGEIVKTELWLVPAGAENPLPVSTARKFDEYGRIPSGEFKARVDTFFVELGNTPDSKGYILLFGSAQTIAREEKRIRSYLRDRNFDPARITFKNGGLDKVGKTEFWVIQAKPKIEPKTKIYIVPSGAKPPTQ